MRSGHSRLCRRGVHLVMATFLLAGCGASTSTSPAGPGSPDAPATNATTPAPVFTGPLPSGQWTTTTDFGSAVLTVDDSGRQITEIKYQFSGLLCSKRPAMSSVTLTTGTLDWSISNGSFEITNVLDQASMLQVTIGGTYDPVKKMLTGNWFGQIAGQSCSGAWSAPAPV